MNLTYQWSISGMTTLPSYQGNENVVTSISYTILGQDTNSIDTSHNFGTVNTYLLDTGIDFVPFDQLTEEIVISWVQKILGPDQIQKLYNAMAYNLLVRQIQPVGVDTLPWATTSTNTTI
jgi:hypothetical protein